MGWWQLAAIIASHRVRGATRGPGPDDARPTGSLEREIAAELARLLHFSIQNAQCHQTRSSFSWSLVFHFLNQIRFNETCRVILIQSTK